MDPESMEYLDRLPDEVPPGKVLVHNHIKPTRQLVVSHFA